MADWKSILGTVAPTLATALGGPFAGMAVSAIGSAIGLGPDKYTEESIAKALGKPTDEILLQLKQAELGFAARMKELDIDVMRINQQDKDSARRREVDAHDSLTPRLLALSAVLLLLVCIVGSGWLLVMAVEMDSNVSYLFGTITGAVVVLVKSVYDYYFGSSQGSMEQNVLLYKSTPPK